MEVEKIIIVKFIAGFIKYDIINVFGEVLQEYLGVIFQYDYCRITFKEEIQKHRVLRQVYAAFNFQLSFNLTNFPNHFRPSVQRSSMYNNLLNVLRDIIICSRYGALTLPMTIKL